MLFFGRDVKNSLKSDYQITIKSYNIASTTINHYDVWDVFEMCLRVSQNENFMGNKS